MQCYSVSQVCKLASIARSTFYLLAKDGRGPVVTKIGSRSVVLERDYLMWLDKQPKQ